MTDWPKLVCQQGHYCHSFTIQGNEFDFISLAILVDRDYRADVPLF